MDIMKRYPDNVWIGPDNFGYIQNIVMDEFPYFCEHCKSLGHFKKEIVILHPHLAREPTII
ncbi:hypothetical protein IEQ34_005900 [Dendrobium chrysotoxum]|uniref:Uncharacterized protein n=1 Tax=Dendrobium chrysotoxum TaxID=161865 RepID=A0AAV7HD29_DENCH|nr:hypothetical protein IEQ34_005900 [Dendrobium chrysotoxum]